MIMVPAGIRVLVATKPVDFRRGADSLALFWKRLEQGTFRWPPISDGVMRLTASQLAALVDGLDWSRLHAHDVPRPTAAS